MEWEIDQSQIPVPMFSTGIWKKLENRIDYQYHKNHKIFVRNIRRYEDICDDEYVPNSQVLFTDWYNQDFSKNDIQTWERSKFQVLQHFTKNHKEQKIVSLYWGVDVYFELRPLSGTGDPIKLKPENFKVECGFALKRF